MGSCIVGRSVIQYKKIYVLIACGEQIMYMIDVEGMVSFSVFSPGSGALTLYTYIV